MSMHPPPDPDELASDLVDGLLDDDVAARLRSDPAIAARVVAIEAARAALRVPPPSSPGAVDRALAATFAALDRGVAPDDRPPPPVTHLRSVGAPGGGPPTSTSTSTPSAGGRRAPTPAHRARRGSSGMPWLAAAAAIVLLGLVTIGILSSDSDSDDSQASDAAASAEIDDDASTGGGGDGGAYETSDEGAGDEAATDQPPAADQAPATTQSEPLAAGSDLGAVSSAAELADRIRAQGEPADTVTENDTGTTDRGSPLGEAGASFCAGRTPDGEAARGESLYVADAVLDGTPVRVHVYESGDGSLRLVATDEACVDVVDVPFSD